MTYVRAMYMFVTFLCWPAKRVARYASESMRGREILEHFVAYQRRLLPLLSATRNLTILIAVMYAARVLITTAAFFLHPGVTGVARIAISWIWLYLGVAVVELVIDATGYFESPEGKAKEAGYYAERMVKRVVSNIAKTSKSRDFHNLLLVLNPGTPSEFSMEIDHLLITERNIFIFETKYKTGTVFVNADAPSWHVQHPIFGKATMRNALVQVKNTCRQLERYVAPGIGPIPVVVLVSRDEAEINGDISNVITLEKLPGVVSAFDRKFSSRALDLDAVCNALMSRIDNTREARRKHIQRANEKKMRADDESITGRASI
jgi:hypothetical protein